jgi:hypothetical protein
MKVVAEKIHSCGQAIWVKGWIDGKTIFCIGPPGQRKWVEHCPKCGERLTGSGNKVRVGHSPSGATLSLCPG